MVDFFLVNYQVSVSITKEEQAAVILLFYYFSVSQ